MTAGNANSAVEQVEPDDHDRLVLLSLSKTATGGQKPPVAHRTALVIYSCPCLLCCICCMR
jgi:hypothetical protein